MHLVKKLLILYIFVPVLLASCRGVIFDEEISFTIEVSERMTSEVVVGPLTIPDTTYDERNDEVYFIPEKGVYDKGFIIWKRKEILYIWYVNEGGVLSNNLSFTLDTYTAYGLDIFLEPIADNAGQLFFINFNHINNYKKKQSLYDIAYYQDNTLSWRSGGDHYDLSNELSVTFGGEKGWDNDFPVYVNGAYISPHTNLMYLLCYDGEMAVSPRYDYRYYEFFYAFDSDGVLVDGHALRCGDNEDDWINLHREMRDSFFYGYDSITNKSFASYYNTDFSHYETFTWDAVSDLGGAVNNLNIQKQGRYLFSTSRLYTKLNGVVDIYDDNGHRLYSFSPGKLRLNYEYYGERGYFLMVFSHTEVVAHNNARFNFHVFTHKTKDIDELDW